MSNFNLETSFRNLVVLIFILIKTDPTVAEGAIHGRYSENIQNYHLAVPHKATPEGEFATFHLPHLHDYDVKEFGRRRKRELDDLDSVHYGIMLDNELHHIELWPDRDLVHPQAVFEWYDPTQPVHKRDVKGVQNKKMCYYLGRVRGVPDSKVSLSTCDGLTGYVNIGKKLYFVEPVAEHSPNKKGHHLHVVYHPTRSNEGFCAVDDSQENWEKEVKKRLAEEYKEGKDIFRRAAEEHVETVPQWMELLVVCDKKMVFRHKGKRDIEQWILTLFGKVKSLYADGSMTAVLQPVIVRIIYLEKEEEELDLQIKQDARETLSNFCKWVQKLQVKEESHPNHFDMAILMSEWDFCSDGGTRCSTAGLGTIAGACSTVATNCQLTEDVGLDTMVILTHEIGHLLGMQHDLRKNPCPANDTDGSWFVMSPTGNAFTLRWSPCSPATVRELNAQHLLDCLNDEPEFEQYTIGDDLPGVVYDHNAQCITHGREIAGIIGACPASNNPDKLCYALSCLTNTSECFIHWDFPMADGTPCDTNKWCIRRECVEKGTRPKGIDGGWGDWGEWSKCTKTCSRGTQFKERLCDNPKPTYPGKHCLGPTRKMRICNPQECPFDSVPFRTQQCMKFLAEANVTNEFFYSEFRPDEPCKVFCVTKDKTGQEVLEYLPRMLEDGAKCEIGNPLKMCIKGVCTEVPCDNKLSGSQAIADRCGNCNGDGTRCKIVNDTAEVQTGKEETYSMLTVIPAGSRSVKIYEVDYTWNFLALGLPDNKTVLFNHEGKRMPAGVYPLGQKHRSYLLYSSSPSNVSQEFLDIETITWDQTREDIGLYVCHFSQTVDKVGWTWVEPSDTQVFQPKYTWEIAEYKECTKKCDGGTQIPVVSCFEETTGKVADSYCEKLEKPADHKPQKCNLQPCPIQWKVGKWGRCRACKKKGGVRVRQVQCTRMNPNLVGDDIIVEDSECKEIKPGTVELCDSHKKCGSSRRRKSIYVPGKFQESIWKQMNKRHIVAKRGAIKTPHVHLKGKNLPPCTNATTAFTWKPSTIHIGEFVVDNHDAAAAGMANIVVHNVKVVEVNSSGHEDNLEGAQPRTVLLPGTTRIIKELEFPNKYNTSSTTTTKSKNNETVKSTTNPAKKSSDNATESATEGKCVPVTQTDDNDRK